MQPKTMFFISEYYAKKETVLIGFIKKREARNEVLNNVFLNNKLEFTMKQ